MAERRRARFKVDTFTLYTGKRGSLKPEQIFKSIFALPSSNWDDLGTDNRWGDAQGYIVQIENVSTYEGVTSGIAIGVRRSDLDSVMGFTGPDDSRLRDDEGLGRSVAWLWDPVRKVFWFQRDDRAIRIGAFADYIRSKTTSPFGTEPIYDEEAIARAMKKKVIKTISVKFERNGAAADAIEGLTPEVDEFVALRKKYGAAVIEVTLRQPDGVLMSTGKKLLKGITNLLAANDEAAGSSDPKVAARSREDVMKASVEAFDDDDEGGKEVLNLLRERFAFEAPMTETRYGNPDELKKTIRLLWNENRDKIRV